MTAAILLLGFFGLLAMGLPLAIALAGSGIVFAYIDGTIPMLAIVHRMASGVDSFPLLCVPFFILAGLLTPPVGNVLFILARVRNIGFEDAARGVWPFMIPLVGVLMLCTYVPEVVMWLPTMWYR